MGFRVSAVVQGFEMSNFCQGLSNAVRAGALEDERGK